MKKFLGWVLVIVLIPICYIMIINMQIIDVDDYKYANKFQEQKKVRRSGVNFSIIETGNSSTLETFIVKTGSLFKNYTISHSAILITHPKGNILFDTGLGEHVDEQFDQDISVLFQLLLKYNKTKTASFQLEQNGFPIDSIDLIIPSHLHWDHASGLIDFPNANILICQEEKKWSFEDFEEFSGYSQSQYINADLNWQEFNFQDNPYENFEKSYDVFDDGSVILLPIPGHTPGSLGLFLTTNTGDKYLFTGDLTWSLRGFELPAHKFSLSSDVVDYNLELLKESIARVYFLKKRYPELHLVPSHDYEGQKRIGFFPKFVK